MLNLPGDCSEMLIFVSLSLVMLVIHGAQYQGVLIFFIFQVEIHWGKIVCRAGGF